MNDKAQNLDCYQKKPIRYEGIIPIFSNEDEYIKNYEKISADHLSELKKSGINPFMGEEEWASFEESTAKHVLSYSKKGDKILDIGVGLGRMLDRFPNLDRYGVDISLGYLKESSTKGITTCLAKIEELPYKDEYFDILLCTDVLEHVLDLNHAVQNILRVLKKGGILIIRVPYREDLSQYLTPGYPYYYVHVRNFDENYLTLFFTRVFNCTVVKWDTVGEYVNEQRTNYYVKYYGRFWKFYQWYYNNMKKYFYSKYINLFYKREINFIVKK